MSGNFNRAVYGATERLVLTGLAIILVLAAIATPVAAAMGLL